MFGSTRHSTPIRTPALLGAGLLVTAPICIFAFQSAAGMPAAPPPVRGFTAQSSAAERKAEETFRAIPKPENNREYMRTISAEPHHAGSPGSRKVAEYILGQFTSWGLN